MINKTEFVLNAGWRSDNGKVDGKWVLMNWKKGVLEIAKGADGSGTQTQMDRLMFIG